MYSSSIKNYCKLSTSINYTDVEKSLNVSPTAALVHRDVEPKTLLSQNFK